MHCGATLRKAGLLWLGLACGLGALLANPDRRLAARSDPFVPEPANQKSGLTVEVWVSAGQTTFAPLEPIRASVKYTNVGDHEIHIDQYTNRYQTLNFEVDDVRQPAPRRVPWTCFHDRQVEGGRKSSWRGDCTLKPGESSKESLIVNLVADMTAPTEYKIVAAVPCWPSTDRSPDQQRVIRSAPIRVEVKGEIQTPPR